MRTLEKSFEESRVEYSKLNRKDGYALHHQWLELFAWKVKEKTGKYTINGFVWEAYWAGIIPSIRGEEGLRRYQGRLIEDYYIIFENGDEVFSCSSSEWPDFFGMEVIVFPCSKTWSMVFSHEQSVHYVEPE